MHVKAQLLRWLRDYRGTLLFLGLMFAFRSSYADWMVVPTGSMNPTVVEGDRILVDKHAYGWRIPFTTTEVLRGSDPQPGELVVFYSPADGTRLIKRVVGVPGDVIEMKNETLFINGRALRYTPDSDHPELLNSTLQAEPLFLNEQLGANSHEIMLLPSVSALQSFGPIHVGRDEYLMLGDNRDNSADSRYIGLVPRKNIVGKATRVLISLNPESLYAPRQGRFGKRLT